MRSWSGNKDVHIVEDITAVGRCAGMKKDDIAECFTVMNTDT